MIEDIFGLLFESILKKLFKSKNKDKLALKKEKDELIAKEDINKEQD